MRLTNTMPLCTAHKTGMPHQAIEPIGAAAWRGRRRIMTSTRLCPLVPPQRVHGLIRLPDRDHLPPAPAHWHREILSRAAAPVRDLEGLRRPPTVGTKVLGPEAHRRLVRPRLLTPRSLPSWICPGIYSVGHAEETRHHVPATPTGAEGQTVSITLAVDRLGVRPHDPLKRASTR